MIIETWLSIEDAAALEGIPYNTLVVRLRRIDDYKTRKINNDDLDAYISNVVEDKVYALKKGGC